MAPSSPQKTTMLPGEAKVTKWLDNLQKPNDIHDSDSKSRDAFQSHDPGLIKRAKRTYIPDLICSVALAIEKELKQGIQEAPRELREAIFLGKEWRDLQDDAADLFKESTLAQFLLTACCECSITLTAHSVDNNRLLS